MCENPKLANTVRSQKNFFPIFENLNFQGIQDSYDDISKIFEYFLKIQNWLTLRGVKLIFENLQLQGIQDPYDDISKIFEYFLKIKNWLTLCGVGLRIG